MKPDMKRLLKTAGIIILTVCLFFGAGPGLIHLGYGFATPDSEGQTMQDRNTSPAKQEALDKSIDQTTRTRLQEERLKLFHWSHARGWRLMRVMNPMISSTAGGS